jgi:hypothetical protein
VGRLWERSGSPIAYDYVAAEVTGSAWQHVSQIVRPPAGSTSARLWLLNVDASGAVDFDETVFVALPE